MSELQTTRARQVVVITGGTAGVGRATARRFAESGADVAVLARGRAGLEATARELSALGVRARALEVDVSDARAVREAAQRVEQELGPIDVWINNAMTTIYGRIRDIAPEEFKRATEVTYLGYVYGTQAALALMEPRNRGIIVQVGSSLAYRGIPLQAPYCAAKHAIRSFTNSLRAELIHDGFDIHVTMVQLPSLNTPQFDQALNRMERRPQPVPPIYQPEVAAEAIHYATRVRRREIYVGPSTLQLIAAQKLMPGVLDHYVARRVWDGQLTSEPAPPSQRTNLFTPIHDRDAGAHGRFDDRSQGMDASTALTLRLGAAGARSLFMFVPLVGAGFLLGRALASAPRRTRAHASQAPRAWRLQS